MNETPSGFSRSPYSHLMKVSLEMPSRRQYNTNISFQSKEFDLSNNMALHLIGVETGIIRKMPNLKVQMTKYLHA